MKGSVRMLCHVHVVCKVLQLLVVCTYSVVGEHFACCPVEFVLQKVVCRSYQATKLSGLPISSKLSHYCKCQLHSECKVNGLLLQIPDFHNAEMARVEKLMNLLLALVADSEDASKRLVTLETGVEVITYWIKQGNPYIR